MNILSGRTCVMKFGQMSEGYKQTRTRPLPPPRITVHVSPSVNWCLHKPSVSVNIVNELLATVEPYILLYSIKVHDALSDTLSFMTTYIRAFPGPVNPRTVYLYIMYSNLTRCELFRTFLRC